MKASLPLPSKKSAPALFPSELKLIQELQSQGVSLEALRVQLLMQSFLDAGLHEGKISEEGLAAIKKNIEILANSPHFFQMKEAQKIFGTLVGVILSNSALLEHLRGKKIPEELRQVLFSAPQFKAAAAASSGDSKLILNSFLWILQSGNKGDDKFLIWQREMSKIAMAKIVQVLKSKGFDTDMKFMSENGKSTTFLSYAIASGNLEATEILFAERDKKSPESLKELVSAIAMADSAMFKVLQAKKEFAEVINGPELAARISQIKVEERFLCALGLVSPYTKEVIAMTAKEKIEAIKNCLKRDRDCVNAPLQFAKKETRLPLSVAIDNGREEEVVEFLLDNGADIHKKCLDKKYSLDLSPLFYAMQGFDSIYIDLFLKKGLIKINELKSFGSDLMTMLAFSAQVNNVHMVQHLLARGENPDVEIVVNTKRTTPLKSIITEYADDGGSDENKVKKETAILKAMISFSNDLDKKFTWDVGDSLAQMTLEEAFDMRCRIFDSEKIKEYAQEVKAAFAERRSRNSDKVDSSSAAAASEKDLPEINSSGAMMLRAIAKNNIESVRSIMESLGDNQQFGGINYLSYAIVDNKIDIAKLILSHPEIQIDKDKILENLKISRDATFAALVTDQNLRYNEKTQRGFFEDEIVDIALYRVGRSIFLRKSDNGSLVQEIEQLKMFFPSQNPQQLASKRFDFIRGLEKKKITILSSAIEAENLEIVGYLLKVVGVNPDEQCLERGFLESPLLKCIKLNQDNPSQNNARILGLLIANSKILNTTEGCNFILESCKETIMPLSEIINQAILARKDLSIPSQVGEVASFNSEELGINLVSVIIRNIEALKVSEDPVLLDSIKEKFELLKFQHAFTEIINSNKLGFVISAAIINPKLKEIILPHSPEAVRLILSNQPIEDNDHSKKCLVNALSLCLQSNPDPKSFEFEAVKRIVALLPENSCKIKPNADYQLVQNVAQYEDPSLISALLKKGLWNVNSTFQIKDGTSINLLPVVAAFGKAATVNLLLSYEDIKLDKDSLIVTLKTCSSEVFKALTESPKLKPIFTKNEVKHWRSYRLIAEVINEAVSNLCAGLPLKADKTGEIIKKLSALGEEKAAEKAMPAAVNKIFTLSHLGSSSTMQTFLGLAIDANCEPRLIECLLKNGASLEEAKKSGQDPLQTVIYRYKAAPNRNDRDILMALIQATENLSMLQDAKNFFSRNLSPDDKLISKEFAGKERDLMSKVKPDLIAEENLDKFLKEIDGKESKKPKKSPEEMAELRKQEEANRLRNLEKAQEKAAAKKAEEERQEKLRQEKELAEKFKQQEKERAKQEQKIKEQQEKQVAEERKRISAARAKEKAAAEKIEAERKLAAAKEAEAAAKKKEEEIKNRAQAEFEADKRAFGKRQESLSKSGQAPEDIKLLAEIKLKALRKIPEGNPIISKQIELWEQIINPSSSPRPKGEESLQLSEAAVGASRS